MVPEPRSSIRCAARRATRNAPRQLCRRRLNAGSSMLVLVPGPEYCTEIDNERGNAVQCPQRARRASRRRVHRLHRPRKTRSPHPLTAAREPAVQAFGISGHQDQVEACVSELAGQAWPSPAPTPTMTAQGRMPPAALADCSAAWRGSRRVTLGTDGHRRTPAENSSSKSRARHGLCGSAKDQRDGAEANATPHLQATPKSFEHAASPPAGSYWLSTHTSRGLAFGYPADGGFRNAHADLTCCAREAASRWVNRQPSEGYRPVTMAAFVHQKMAL